MERKGFEPSTPTLRAWCFRCPPLKLPDGCVSCETLARNSRSVEHEIGKPQGSAAPKLSGRREFGRCLCGAVETRDRLPAFWAWHDHSLTSRRGHRGASGLGLHGQTGCPPQGLSRYRLGTPEIAEAHPRHRGTLSSTSRPRVSVSFSESIRVQDLRRLYAL